MTGLDHEVAIDYLFEVCNIPSISPAYERVCVHTVPFGVAIQSRKVTRVRGCVRAYYLVSYLNRVGTSVHETS